MRPVSRASTTGTRARSRSSGRWHRLAGALFALALVLAGASPVEAQQTGTVIGRVTDAATGAPIAAANVVVAGTQLGTTTSDDGRFTLRNLNTGPIELLVNRIGYEAKRAPVTVLANQSATVNVTLTQAAFSLSAVVTTATGQQRKVELANTTSQINLADKVAELPASTLGQVLSGRSAGVQVTSGGGAGQGSRIRIRGQSSLSLSNEPVVIIDGVRATSTAGSSAIGVGGSSPSRLDDINPEEIENIEIIKGPSAATLYGTEAANGVINITTKRGKSGRTRYSFYSEFGTVTDPRKGSYPELYALFGKTGTSTTSARCFLSAVAAGTCVADSLSSGNVLNIDSLTPISTGDRRQVGLQVSGGNDRVQFFVSGETEGETGVYRMPAIEVARLQLERGTTVPSTQLRPNALGRNSLRANLSSQIANNFFLNVSSAYVNSTARFPQNEDNANGLMVDALGGTWEQTLKDGRGITLMGYRAFPMGDVLSQTTTQQINRFINSGQANYTPLPWLTMRANVGIDYTLRVDNYINKLNEGPLTGVVRTGQVNNQRTELNQQTVDVGSTASWVPMPWLSTKTSVGMQYIRNYLGRTGGSGNGLPPGGTTLSALATRTPTQQTDEKRTLGYYAEEVVGIRDRLFITGGLRRDAASAFGKDFRAVYYPKVGASWLVSEESFLPRASWLNTLRLRATYGASGQIPGPTDALLYYDPFSATLPNGSDAAGVTLGSLGNSKLKPEYSAEVEAGFDLTLFDNWTNLEVTHYDKQTTDALIQRNVAPSLAGVAQRFENIGDINNRGLELVLNQRLLDRQQIAADFTITGSTNRNRMTALPEGISALFTGNRNTQRNQVGSPLFGLWARPYTFDDANKDGIIARTELTVADSAVFVGPSFPTRELAFSPTIELLNRKLRISGQFDRKWGYKKFNNTLRHQCQGGASCRGLYDKNADLDTQAGALAANLGLSFINMFEDGNFTRFRELSVAYELPTRVSTLLRSQRASVILTGRNLAVWTDYRGVDPEASASNSTDLRGSEEYFATAPMRYFTFRLNVNF